MFHCHTFLFYLFQWVNRNFQPASKSIAEWRMSSAQQKIITSSHFLSFFVVCQPTLISNVRDDSILTSRQELRTASSSGTCAQTKREKIKTGYKLCFVSNKKKAAWEGLEKLLNKRTVWNVIWCLTYKYFPIFMQMLRGEKIFSLKAFAKRVHWKGIGKMMSNLVICISLNFLSGYFSSEEKSNYSHGRWSITFPRILKEMF